MHYTKVVMKDGREFNAPVTKFMPELGWLSLMGSAEQLLISDILSAVTEDGRPGEELDEIERARDYMRHARRNGWVQKDTPIFEWEEPDDGDRKSEVAKDI